MIVINLKDIGDDTFRRIFSGLSAEYEYDKMVSEDIRKWIIENNISVEYRSLFRSSNTILSRKLEELTRYDYFSSASGEHLVFDNDDDAVLFKLAWL